MSLLDVIRKDLEVNKNNRKGQFIVFCYRVSSYIVKSKNPFIRILGFPFVKFYDWTVNWVMGVEIPTKMLVGPGLQVWHGVGLIINPHAVIGKNVLLRHSTTIGNKYEGSKCPVIGDNVNIGAHCVIIGDVMIGDNVIIGAGTIVTKSIPANTIAYGNPMILKPSFPVTSYQ